MSNLLISAIFIVALLGCILATLLIRMMIIAEINSKRDARSQISFLDRDFLGILSQHRQMYPKSLLRKYIILTLALTVALGLSFTLVQNLRN
jgi:pilus assembly protein TadC